MGIEERLKILDSLENGVKTECGDILKELKEKSSLNLSKIKFVLSLFAFVLGFMLAFLLLSSGKLHINLFLFLSVVLPLVLTINSFWLILKTLKNKPLKLEFFGLNLMEKFIKTKNRFIGHALLLYLQIAAVFYVVGFIAGMFFVFLFKNVTFYYESTFDITPSTEEKILNLFAVFKKLDINSLTGNDIVIYIFSVLAVFVIIPRILVYLFYKFRLNGLLDYFIQNHPHYKKLIADCGGVKIEAPKSNQEFKKEAPKRKESLKTPLAKEFKNEAHFLFYQNDKTDSNIECVKTDKKIFKWAFNYFGQSDEEMEKIIDSLNNEVYIVINANKDIIPNEEFKEYVQKIANNPNVKKIYLLLCQDGRVANRLSFVNYEIWKKFADTIDKVQIYEGEIHV